MSIHLITLSDESMDISARLCMSSATRNGVDFLGYWPWSDTFRRQGKRKDVGLKGTKFYQENQRLLKQPRGLGFWAWKPFIIQEAMVLRSVGDILIYADAGVEFIAPISHIINRMDQDIFLFGNNWEHAHWCKRDVIDAIWNYPIDLPPPGFANFPEKGWSDWKKEWNLFGKQVQASVIFFRVSDYTRKFVKEWLDWCLFEGGRLIDDSPSRLPNHPEFREHRHDQAILTTMAYREGIRLHWWGARYNMDQPNGGFVYDKLPEYAADDYEPFVWHHRRRNHEWDSVAASGS